MSFRIQLISRSNTLNLAGINCTISVSDFWVFSSVDTREIVEPQATPIPMRITATVMIHGMGLRSQPREFALVWFPLVIKALRAFVIYVDVAPFLEGLGDGLIVGHPGEGR